MNVLAKDFFIEFKNEANSVVIEINQTTINSQEKMSATFPCQKVLLLRSSIKVTLLEVVILNLRAIF